MKEHPKCSGCSGPCKSKLDYMAREDGRFVCRFCWNSLAYKKYREHWFVRDIKYTKPTITAKRGRRPLPGQQELGFSDDGEELGHDC